MRNLSSKFRHEMYYGNHSYDHKAVVTLASGTVLTLTNTTLWAGGFSFDDAVSEDNSFTALGSTVIGSAKVIINNIDESYSDYDFTNAKVALSLSKTYLSNGQSITETIKIGKYTVDESTYNGGTITLSLLDNMEQFDRPYSGSNLSYPTTLLGIIQNACLDCGVTLDTYSFPHSNFTIQSKPTDDAITYRDVIGWVATIAGCFARCNADGKLTLKWFDLNTLASLYDDLDGGVFDSSTPYASGDSADGGSFNPWNTGTVYDDGEFSAIRPVHYLSRLYSQSVGIDDIVITGVHITVEEPDANNNEKTKTYKFGQNGYVIKIQNNKLINKDNVSDIGTWLANAIVGIRFRNATVTHLDDPAIEAGDIGLIIDRKQNEYPILVTRTSYSAGGSQTTVCGAESASRNSATRYSDATKAYVDARKLLNEEQTARKQAVQNLYNALAEKSGLYSTQETAQGGGTIYYLHDKPLLADSMVVWKMTSEAWGVSTDGGQHWNAGMTVDGDTIVRILTATGVNANWINTGALTILDGDEVIFSADCDTGRLLIDAKDIFGNSNFRVDTSTGEVDIIANSFSLVAGDDETKSIADIADEQIQDANIPGQINNAFTQEKVFNTLTNNGTLQGIFMKDGQLYINMSYLNTGILQLYRNNVETMYVNANTGEVRLSPNTFTLSGQTVSQIADSRINNADIPGQIEDGIDDAMTQQNIFNKLTNNGQTQGIVLRGNKLYINWEYAVGGTLTLGGYNNNNGYLHVKNSGNNTAVDIDNTGISLVANNYTHPAKIFGRDASYNIISAIHVGEESNGEAWQTSSSSGWNVNGSGINMYSKYGVTLDAPTVALCYYTNSDYSQSGHPDPRLVAMSNGTHIVKESLYLHAYARTIATDYESLMVASDGEIKTVTVTSSRRYKHVYKKVTEEDIKDVYNIKVYMAKYKDGHLIESDPRNGKIYPMFIAEQMQRHLPIAVDLNSDGKAEKWNEHVIIPIMFQMIKDQKTKIDEQENEIKELKEKLSDIEGKLNDILNVYKLNNTL